MCYLVISLFEAAWCLRLQVPPSEDVSFQKFISRLSIKGYAAINESDNIVYEQFLL